ncbi:glycoside hydrolase family 16 protein [Pseudarthrobacter sp. C4D7]|uniref:glycoside hydrolase family 16 protein n=1 Tax=Pseudarthrobacter sp. C4D7 TaxID=2735268 RepID=UPI001584C2CD|nr:glycoside hydrolase family 16 protein [Pseudarthrobacter sp. C4D7]NUT70581.1 glycoside hydrolase family 16 protein [Pseudarthrobacter sp. C4D7]
MYQLSLVTVTSLSIVGVALLALHADSVKDSGAPKGDLPSWRQTMVQDFDVPAPLGAVGQVYGPDMRGYSDFSDSSGFGTYTPDDVLSVHDGYLDFHLHYSNDRPRVASVIPFGYTGQTYGRYSVRFRYDAIPGYKMAFLLWPSSDDWNEGEIDWPEGALDGSLYGNSAIKGTRTTDGMDFDPADKTYSKARAGQWHVATIEWKPGLVRWFLDDELVDQTTKPRGVPDTPMRWTLQVETADDAKADFPAAGTDGHLQVDWVAQYAYTP